MYSQFVQSLGDEQVSLAKLEHGTGRLFYSLKPSGTAAAAAALAAAQASSAASSSPIAVESTVLPAALSTSPTNTATTIIAITAAPSISTSAPSISTDASLQPAAAVAAATAAATTSAAAAAAAQNAAQMQRFIKLADTTDPALIKKILDAAVPFYVFKVSSSRPGGVDTLWRRAGMNGACLFPSIFAHQDT